MGNENGKGGKVEKQPELSLDDQMLELRMASKKFEMESKRSEREKTKQMNKAKVALQKGNEEGARLYLANAAMKQKESLSQLRMAHKLDAVQSQLKSNQNSQTMVAQLQNITPVLQQTVKDQPLEQIYTDMQRFEKEMDNVMVQNNIVNNIVHDNKNDPNQNIAIDMMLQAIKNEQSAQINNELNPHQNEQFQEVQQQQQNQNQNINHNYNPNQNQMQQ